MVQVFEKWFHTETVLRRAADCSLVDANGSFGCFVRVARSGADADGTALVDDLKERFEPLSDRGLVHSETVVSLFHYRSGRAGKGR